MRGRAWTHNEESLVREKYGKVHPGLIGMQIGRTNAAVQQKARALGLTFDRRAELGGAFTRFLKKKHGEGWSDMDIAREWGANVGTVLGKRRKLGLPANRYTSERNREKLRVLIKAQLKAEGVRNLSALRRQVRMIRAARMGWPSGATMAEALVMEALACGPQTRAMLGAQRSKKLTALVRRGWVFAERRPKCKWYSLAVKRADRGAA